MDLGLGVTCRFDLEERMSVVERYYSRSHRDRFVRGDLLIWIGTQLTSVFLFKGIG